MYRIDDMRVTPEIVRLEGGTDKQQVQPNDSVRTIVMPELAAQVRAMRRASLRIWGAGVAAFALWLAARDGVTLSSAESWLPFAVRIGLAVVLSLVVREWLVARWSLARGINQDCSSPAPERTSTAVPVQARGATPSAQLVSWQPAVTPSSCEGPSA